MIIDISQPLGPAIQGFPIDTPYAEKFVARIAPGVPVNVSAITFSAHCGTHVDAPLHYDDKGKTVSQMDLDVFIGPARVIDARGSTPLVMADDIRSHLKNTPPRVLLRMAESTNPNLWNPQFRAIHANVIDLLHEHGVKLIGVESPSVDPETSKDLPAHMAVNAHDMRILENLVLSHVKQGDYELIALPLKFENLDASPVRAVLRPLR
ncbi:MAG: arylformamidase [Alphaproteobacteria bacterium]|nr:arylformamidase [Alphaproteobacteria bacterium]